MRSWDTVFQSGCTILLCTSSEWGLHSLYTLPTIVVVLFAFPCYLMLWSIFLCAHWTFAYLLWRNFYLDLLSILKWAYFIFLLSNSLYMYACTRAHTHTVSQIEVPYQVHDLQIFSCILQLSFPFLDGNFWSTNVLSFDR